MPCIGFLSRFDLVQSSCQAVLETRVKDVRQIQGKQIGLCVCQCQPRTLMLLHGDRTVLGRQETAAWVACGGVAFCLAYTLVFVPESLSRPAQLLVSPPAVSHSWTTIKVREFWCH